MGSEAPLINAFTVDLEDWFQGLTSTNAQPERWPELESRVARAARNLLALLRAHEIRATFFTLGIVADQHPSLLEEVVADGHEIAVHGYWHRFVSRMRRDEFAAELDRALEAITRVTGTQPLGHRAPYFSINASSLWAFDVLASRGLLYDSSIFPTRNMLYGFPNAPRFPYRLAEANMIEYPATTARFAGRNWPISGGFYVRALPYSLIKRGIRQVNELGQPAVLYVHPWELDTEQVYNQVTARERITHYYGRRGLREKLVRLFSDFTFAPLAKLPLPKAMVAYDASGAAATLS